jgi:hypothetical protein
VAGQHGQQAEVRRPELEGPAGELDPVGPFVDDEPADVAHRVPGPTAAPQDGAQACQQLLELVGLRHIVVRPGLEGEQPGGCRLRPAHEHQQRIAERPEAPGDAVADDAPCADHLQYDEIRSEAPRDLGGLRGIGRGTPVPALVQGVHERVAGADIVVHDQDPRRCAHRPSGVEIAGG